MDLPSGLMATLVTDSVWPFSVLLHSPVVRSHTLVVWEGFGGNISHQFKSDRNQHKSTHRTVLSQEPDTMDLPSGLMATLETVCVWP